jgi:hypothetical protein
MFTAPYNNEVDNQLWSGERMRFRVVAVFRLQFVFVVNLYLKKENVIFEAEDDYSWSFD